MATELSQVIQDALELSDEERGTLAGILIKSLEVDEDFDPEVQAAWAAETERRWKQIESGVVKTIPWDEVRIKLFKSTS